MRVRLKARLRGWCCAPVAPSLKEAGGSMLFDKQVVLVIRCLAAGVLLCHLVLFSAAGLFVYRSFTAWANLLTTAAFWASTVCALLLVIADESAEPPKPAVLVRLLPSISFPLAQAAFAATASAAIAHWSLEETRLPAGRAERYATLALHALNPALCAADIALTAHPPRAAYVPLAWTLASTYTIFCAVFRWTTSRSAVPSIAARGVVGYSAAGAIALVTPVATYFAARAFGRYAAARRAAKERAKEDASLRETNSSDDTLLPTTLALSKETAIALRNEKPSRPSTSTGGSPPSSLESPKLPGLPDTLRRVSAERSSRMISFSFPRVSPMRASMPLNSAATSSNSQPASESGGSVRFSAPPTFRRGSRDGSFREKRFIAGLRRAPTAWEGVPHVAVEIEPEVFRMPAALNPPLMTADITEGSCGAPSAAVEARLTETG